MRNRDIFFYAKEFYISIRLAVKLGEQIPEFSRTPSFIDKNAQTAAVVGYRRSIRV